ncbi:MAG: transcriptional repressor [Clostridiales bacterium]|nr:transcriptional repressor [Clostridiales bacterium]
MQRNTLQRELVLDAVCSLKNHPTPEQVYDYLSERYPSISRSTVYRNINILCQNGQLLRVEVPNAADHVDQTTRPHYHMVCHGCSRVFDVDSDISAPLSNGIGSRNGFRIDGCYVIYTGLCPECLKKQ